MANTNMFRVLESRHATGSYIQLYLNVDSHGKVYVFSKENGGKVSTQLHNLMKAHETQYTHVTVMSNKTGHPSQKPCNLSELGSEVGETCGTVFVKILDPSYCPKAIV